MTILLALIGCVFVALLGLAIGVIAHEIREARCNRDAPDVPLDLGNDRQ